MLSIDRLRITLPPGYEPRAESIARLVADELAVLPIAGRHHLEQLRTPAVEVELGAGDRRIAGRIARAVDHELNRGGQG